MTTKHTILAHMADEAQSISKTTVIDLDAFLALTSEARAARWRQWDRAAKFQAVAQMITRKYGRDWEQHEVEACIIHWDARWGSEPLTSEAAMCAALERLAEENAGSARLARATGEKDDARFFQRHANAYVKALQHYRAGVRPEPTARGWMLPSSRAGEPPHLLHKDGDWICTCASGATAHWASALIIGLEVASELLDRGAVGELEPRRCDPPGPSSLGDEEGDEPPPYRSAAQLGQRIAAARRRSALAA